LGISAADSNQALEMIVRSERVLVVTHVSPDGDAIGSLLGLGLILERLGKEQVTLACDGGLPSRFDFLPGAAKTVESVSPPYDLVITVDCSDARRGGGVFDAAFAIEGHSLLTINIDHHITNTRFADVNLVLPETVSTTQVLVLLLREWGIELDVEIALCLLTGLVTDTLCFRTANVTPQVMLLAGELMEAGADLALITSNTVNRKPFDAIRYWAVLLESLSLDDRVVSVSTSAESRRQVSERINGDASIVSFLATAQEADVAVSFVETDDGRVEISFRSKPGFDVSKIALDLGGGGHPTAAGCSVNGPLLAVKEQVLTRLKRDRHY
jgi:phosphoesterase RecJ-like protein